MNWPPPKHSTPPEATPGQAEHLAHSPHHGHDRHASSPSSLPNSSSSVSHIDITRHRSRSTFEITSPSATGALGSVFTPSSPPVVVSRLRKASSSSQIIPGSGCITPDPDSLSEDEDIIFAMGGKSERNGAAMGLRPRFSATSTSNLRQKDKLISTGPQRGAGETETELDEPPRHLPTSRILPTPPPLTPPTPLARVTPLLFQTFRLLSVVPAFAGACYHLFNIYQPQSTHSRLDHIVCLFWALLTAHQCLRLTTGLLTRWKAYYPPLATLIRLLALQAICWPATQYTLVLFNHDHRPVVCWAIIGSTTCVSRSIQIWVTSNLWGQSNLRHDGKGTDTTGIKWGARRWDWTEVGVKCALPMGVVYFVMAWAEALRRELNGC